MDIKKLSTDLGVRRIDESHYQELKNLNLLDIPRIKKCLTERERKLKTPKDEIEKNVKLIARAIKLRLFSDSRYPIAKRLGKVLRRMVVNELCLIDYSQYEQAIILDVSKYTIRRDIRAIDKIPNNTWWQKVSTEGNIGIPITKEWEFTSPPYPHDVFDDGSGVNGDGI